MIKISPLVLLLLCLPLDLLAQSKKNKTVLNRDLVSCQDIAFGKKAKIQSVCCNEDIPGVIKPKGGLVVFTPLKLKNRQVKLRAKKRGKPLPKKWKSLIKATKELCPIEEDDEPQTPTPTITPTPSPVEPKHWNFQGEVNVVGKECFEIPQNLAANVITGEETWNTHCEGCHGSQTAQVNKKFAELRSRIAANPMFLTSEDVPDEDLANITAYLNRFNPNECPE